MTTSHDRLDQWRRSRTRRLAELEWVRTDTSGGRPVRFVADEILVAGPDDGDGGVAAARQALTGLGHRGSDIAENRTATGVRRLRVPGLDVAAAVRLARAAAPAGTVVGANHVFLSTPHEHGGPFGPPSAAVTAPTLAVPDDAADPVRVVVMDTGVWADSPLPLNGYLAAPEAYETNLDADSDGNIDSDVGHANFIAGVVLQGTARAQVRIIKVLDTFGLCTEADLAASLTALDDFDVLNLSLGGFSSDDQPPAVLAQALGSVLSAGDRMLVAAAGNDGVADRPFWPAAFAGADVPWADRVLGVAAHDGSAICDWSNSGPWVGLAAPGADVVSTYVNHAAFEGGWATWSGTSFATPHVVAALVEQAAASGSPTAAAKALRESAARAPLNGYPALW
ncbi:hypothetical protein GCM10023322_75290 [Rugosimonospora acidiphila]|uniref:Peptidase S8/S53 domain-containing protein n=1 Tax=Rugosimonospora acidiphila TaxID=556531 RepID=A0ABP9SP11_9ACTN